MSLNFGDLYRGVVINRMIMFNTHGKVENKSKFKLKSFILLLILCVKFILALFFKKAKYPTCIGLNWGPYKGRFADCNKDLTIINYFYNVIDRDQIVLYKYTKVSQIIRLLVKNNFKYDLSPVNNYDNFFYRITNAIEYNTIYNFILENKFEHIYINGLNDRYCIFLSEICNQLKIRLSVIQHGALTKFIGCMRMSADDFFYMYDFSLPFLQYFFENVERMRLIKCESKKRLMSLGTLPTSSNVAFACTPSNVDLNLRIINEMLSGLSPKMNLIIHPHPRESIEFYNDQFKIYPNVIVTKEKFKNIFFLVTRISSLGVELNAVGIEPVFINLEKHETDFLSTGKFKSFTNLGDFSQWLKFYSPISHFYGQNT